ncbi:VOC family protein [Streptomyces himastatinicus]|uniref:VOC family protein n=1 Tax=Streptomyces himastatinicus TaxID=998084 RepID=UPI001FE00C87|nr:VOC family protein [Streptomyces himastatinicus]
MDERHVRGQQPDSASWRTACCFAPDSPSPTCMLLGVALWFKTGDAQALHDRLQAAGTPIVKEPEDGPFGRMFTFLGPEGYAITAHGN